jgi:translation initiation factor 6
LGLKKLDINGNPYIGIFCAANDEFVIAPKNISKGTIRRIQKTMEVDVFTTTIGGSTVIGALLALNSRGVVVTEFVEENELKEVEGRARIAMIPDKLNAAGNNILVNDNAALIHPDLKKDTITIIEDTLDVEVEKGTIFGLKTVGAAAVVTNKGGLFHPKIDEEELKFFEELFKVPFVKGTANYGTPLIGACLIGNTKGAITGNNTTGIELGRIEEGLGLI